MAREPRTIDNLGVDISTRYAQDQARLDTKIIKESGAVQTQTEIDVTTPYFPSEFEELFQMSRRNVSWADFFSPPGYADQKKRLFTHQVVPSLGSDEKQEMIMQRITARARSKKEEEKGQREERMKWEEELELQEEEKEKTTLLKLLEIVHKLNRYLIDINSRRGQYHRG